MTNALPVAPAHEPAGAPTDAGAPRRSWSPRVAPGFYGRLAWNASFLPLIILSTAVFVWFVTYGTWHITRPEPFGQFFDFQARCLLEGRLDVPEQAIGPEAFFRDGKYYGYFGLTPALFRVPLNWLMPEMFGRWSMISCTLAYVVTLAYGTRVLAALEVDAPPRRTRGTWFVTAAFILSLGLGSTLLFLGSRSYIYNEAIIWGGALAVATGYHVLRWLGGATGWHLWAACATGALAVHARPTVGAGAMAVLIGAGLALLPWRTLPVAALLGWFGATGVRPGWARFAAVAGVIVVSVGTMFAINYAKFGMLNGSPLHMHVQFIQNPERLKKSDGKMMNLANVRTTAYNYASPIRLRLKPHFPWVFLTTYAETYPESKVDGFEFYAGLPAQAPSLCVLAVVGVAACAARPGPVARRLRGPMIALAIGGGLTLLAAGITMRYMHDLFPPLLLAAAAGTVAMTGRWGQPAVWAALLAPWVVWSALAQSAFALAFQREGVWGVDGQYQSQFQEWRKTIDTYFGVPPER